MRTLLAYLALMLSSMAWWLCLPKSSGAIWTRSAIFVCEKRSDGGINLGEFNRTTHEDEHFGCWDFWPCRFLSRKSQDWLELGEKS